MAGFLSKTSLNTYIYTNQLSGKRREQKESVKIISPINVVLMTQFRSHIASQKNITLILLELLLSSLLLFLVIHFFMMKILKLLNTNVHITRTDVNKLYDYDFNLLHNT